MKKFIYELDCPEVACFGRLCANYISLALKKRSLFRELSHFGPTLLRLAPPYMLEFGLVEIMMHGVGCLYPNGD